TPDISALDGQTFTTSDEVKFTYPAQTTGFVWQLISSSGTVVIPTGAPQVNFSRFKADAGTYVLRVQAVRFSQTSEWGTANVTLVSADLNAVRVYPNPWRSDKHAGADITFANVSPDVQIKIFTASGRLVRDLKLITTTATWDRKDKAGDTVASGIYLYLITDSDGN